ncbi:ribbon-helix-helix domain-containing protein [Paraburkholderia acidicola]|uniref:Ribbon-helix-helix domain-containing protein n=1 Tax=Paraburkholderia acidicola TaxID=1912599 RepID=A0ABV1LSF2_9BURK
MSPIVVDLAEEQIEALAVLAKRERRSRAAVIREAIDAYITQHQRALEVDVFGMWKGREVDGLEYQRRLRSDW